MKRKSKFIFSIMAATLLATTAGGLSACGKKNNPDDDKTSSTTYTVTLDANGGTLTSNSSYVTDALGKLDFTQISDPGRNGYTFNGWYTQAENGTRVDSTYTFTVDTTIYAQWQEVGGTTPNTTYTVTLDANGGTLNGGGTVVTSTDGKIAIDSIFPPSKSGFTFKGWYTQATGGEKITADTVFSQNTTIYAQWEESSQNTPATYTVTLDANGGTLGGGSTILTDTNGKISLSAITEPTRNGFTFKGWYTQSTDGEKITVDTVFSQNTTIYAQWQEILPDTYTITLNPNGGTLVGASTVTTDYDGKIDLSEIDTPTREGYNFIGWSLTASGNAIDGDNVYATDTTIYALWQIKTYTVTFNAENGDKIDDVTVNHGSDATAPSAPTIIGKTFVGWSASITNVTDDIVVTARYEFIDYTVTYEPNGGSSVDGATKHYGDKLTAPTTPTKTDCTLVGWYTDAECTTAWNFETDTMPARSITLYAKWEKDTSINWYSVAFKLNKSDATAYNTIDISENGTVTVPTTPTKTGYTFVKWFNAADDSEYTFGNAPTDNLTLYATWTLDAPSVTMSNISGEYTPSGYVLSPVVTHAIAEGVTYTYSWYKDGELIVGANGATYKVTNVEDSGEYTVNVTATHDGITSEAETQTATVSIIKAELPEITNIAFKSNNAYSNVITFEADATTNATGYTLTVLSGETQVHTATIAIGADKEFDLSSQALKGEYTVKITYSGIAESNITNVTANQTLTFKGNGTQACAYDVSTANDLSAMSEFANAYFVQTADITDASVTTSIFTSAKKFTGNYDGGNHKISTVKSASGLFGYIGSGAVVKDVEVALSISSNAQNYSGGIASENGGTLQNVTITGSIYNSRGTVNSTVDSNKVSYGTGGIVGKNLANGRIENCTNSATVKGNIVVGGLVGYNMENATVTDCVNNGTIGASKVMYMGAGLVGNNEGTLTKSKNTASVNGVKAGDGSGNYCNHLSGIAAYNASTGTVSLCSNSGGITGDYAAAGIVSKNDGAVSCCINSGSVNARWAACGGTVVEGTGSTVDKCVSTGSLTVSGGEKYGVSAKATDSYYKNGNAGTATKLENTQASALSALAKLGNDFALNGNNVVLATFAENVYTVSFTANQETVRTIAVVEDTELTLITYTAPEHQTFDGWYLSTDVEKTIVTTATITANAEYVAKITKNSYTISFDSDGGTTVDDMTDEYDATISAPTPPTKTGYAFNGWYESGSEDAFDFTANRTDNVSLKAKWTAKNYTLTYELNGGTGDESKTITYNSAYGTLATPSKAGSKFLGWFDKDGSDDGDWGNAVTAETVHAIDGDVTVYAKWETASETLVLEYNYEGCGSAKSIGISSSDETISLENVLTRGGYTLLGFATTAEAQTAEYTTSITKAQFDTLKAEETTATLYAIWEKTTYTITVVLGGGSWTVDENEITDSLTYTIDDTTDSIYTLPAEEPTRAGYEFKGWKITREGESEESIGLSSGYTITAKWEIVESTITLNANGGSLSGETTTVTTTEHKLDLSSIAEPTLSGYTFKGWYTATSGGTKITSTTELTSDTTIYAQWTAMPEYSTKVVFNDATVVIAFTKPSWDGTLNDFYLYTWSSSVNGLTGGWPGAALSKNTVTVNASITSMTGMIFTFKQNGETKQSVDITPNLTVADNGKTITYSLNNNWDDGKFGVNVTKA